MTNEEAIRIINGKAPLIIRDREGGVCDKTDELKTTILSALEKQISRELIKLPEEEPKKPTNAELIQAAKMLFEHCNKRAVNDDCSGCPFDNVSSDGYCGLGTPCDDWCLPHLKTRTVDAVEVVRCKDCVWNKQPQCPLSYTSPVSEDGEVSVWYKNKGNDYCSYGKRKGGGLEDKPATEVKTHLWLNKKGGGSKMIEVEILPNHTKEYMKGYCDAIDEMELKDFVQVIRCEDCELKLTVDCPMCECISTDTEQWLNTWGTPNGYCYLGMPRKENI